MVSKIGWSRLPGGLQPSSHWCLQVQLRCPLVWTVHISTVVAAGLKIWWWKRKSRQVSPSNGSMLMMFSPFGFAGERPSSHIIAIFSGWNPTVGPCNQIFFAGKSAWALLNHRCGLSKPQFCLAKITIFGGEWLPYLKFSSQFPLSIDLFRLTRWLVVN